MKRNLIELLHLQKHSKGTSSSASEIYQNSKKTESLAQLKFSLDNRLEEKETQLQAQQLKEAEEIQDYQKLEELAQNFDFLSLENFLSSNEQTHKITLATYKTFNFRQKILFGFKTKAFIYSDLLNKFFDSKDDYDNYVLPLEIKLYDSKKIKLPELQLLFKELQAMKLQPKLQISICEDYDLININIADLDSGKVSASMFNDLERTKKQIKIEIEINKNKFTN